MSEILTDLHDYAKDWCVRASSNAVVLNAIDEITRLRARLDAVEEAAASTTESLTMARVEMVKARKRAERAEAALAAARRDGVDIAAGYMDQRHADEVARSKRYRSGSNPWFAHVQSAKRYAEDADAIRALANEAKP